MWNNLESLYRETLARLQQDEKLASQVAWVDELPLKSLRDAGIISARKNERVQVLKEFLSFFGVVDRETYEQVWGRPIAAFRQSPKHEKDPVAVAAWLRQGELDAASIACQPYDAEALREALALARALMNDDPSEWLDRLTSEFAAAGVALVLRAEVKGARAFGATRWLTPRKAMIQLSVRRKWEDEFWFSLFHEACHVLRHPKKDLFVSDGDPDDKYEQEANEFAANFLIPPRYTAELLALRRLADIEDFARRLRIPPGIVVGRLQRERVLDYGVGNKGLRRRFELVED
jgi:HTH-type transcriptional regulator/antitoxin HigA